MIDPFSSIDWVFCSEDCITIPLLGWSHSSYHFSQWNSSISDCIGLYRSLEYNDWSRSMEWRDGEEYWYPTEWIGETNEHPSLCIQCSFPIWGEFTTLISILFISLFSKNQCTRSIVVLNMMKWLFSIVHRFFLLSIESTSFLFLPFPL